MTAPALPTVDRWRRWRVEPEWSRVLDVAGVDGTTHRWHVLERRPADAPVATVVCVHGNPTWSYLWRGMLERVGDRHRVVAVDQLGMGFSERTERRRYVERVRDLGDVIDALDVDGPIVVVGHDWGGAVAMGWAVAAGERLAGMVLCNTGIAVPEGRRAPWLIRLAAAGPVTDLVGRRTRIFLEGTLALSRARIATEAREAYRAPYRDSGSRGAIAEFVDDVPFTQAHPSAAAIAAVAERLSSVSVPTLLAWGARDPVFDDSFAHDLAARLPHAELHRFPGAGHLAPEEVDVAGVVDAWLRDRVEPSRSARPTGPAPRAVTSVSPIGPAEVTAPAGRDEWRPLWAALEERSSDEDAAFVDAANGRRTSFAEMHARVMAIAAGLREVGLRPGDRVALLVPPSADLVASVYAVWRAGGVTVVADRGLGLRGLGRAVRGSRVTWVIGPPKALAAARVLRWAPGARTIAVGSRRVLGAVSTLDQLASATAVVPAAPVPDDLAAVLFTSGATGPAKGVRYRHRQLAAQRDALVATYGITRDDRFVAAFAPFAVYGPALGITSTIPDVDVTKPGTLTAGALGAACASVDATIVFAAPAALANVVRTATGPDPRLAGVRLVLSAGAPVPVSTLRATALLAPAAQMHTPYGMTECLPVSDVSLGEIDAAGRDPGVSDDGVCVGRPVPGAEVRIAPLGFDAGAPIVDVPAGNTGEVLVRTPWVSDGYDQLWRTQRDARPAAATGAVWHRSGDVGHLDGGGRLWIEGRSVHVIDTDSGPLTPVPIEVTVERLDGIGRTAAVGVGPGGCQQLVVVVEDRSVTEGLASAELAERVRHALDHPVAAVLTVRELPVDIRHNTKIDRAAVAEWAAQVLSGGRVRRRW